MGRLHSRYNIMMVAMKEIRVVGCSKWGFIGAGAFQL